MYIVIIGGGKVGYYLSKALIEENHEVLIVEKVATEQCSICNELGSICIRGDGCEVAILEEVGTNRADMFIAVTGDDEDNLISCQLAKHKFNVPRTIARISNPANETLFKKLGVDVTVSSTDIILENIREEVPTHALTHLMKLRDRGLEIIEVKIPPDASTIGKSIKELSLPSDAIPAIIISGDGKPRSASLRTIIRAGDQIITVITPEIEDALRKVLRGD
jgi:trk/ktr system potassium uptake protein